MIIALLLITALPAGAAADAESSAITLQIKRDAGSQTFMGFGAEWDVTGYVPAGIGDADFDLIRRRLEWMRLPVVRIQMLARWCYRGDGKFDWDNEHMRMLYRQLEVCQALGITVILTDWGVEEKHWLKVPGIERVDEPMYARVIATYLEHMVREKGFDCIRYLEVVNEPNYEVGDWERWRQAVQNVASRLREQDLSDRITLVGSGHSNADSWHHRAVDQLQDLLGGYSVHRYAADADLRAGQLQQYFARSWRYALDHDPEAAGKPLIVGEAGMADGAQSGGNLQIGEYVYGLHMADYAIQAANAGSHAVLAWMLDDTSHARFFWGMWSSKAEGMQLRPWFYVWSLLCRYVPAGSIIYETEHSNADVRVLAARVPPASEGAAADWTFCIVNRDDEPATVIIQMDEATPGQLRQYIYSETEAPTDDEGFPVPASEQALMLERGLEVQCPPQAVLVLTSTGR